MLCVGSRCSGKSTLAAALTEYVNAHFDRRIAVVQPVAEYTCTPDKSIVTHFETGLDPATQRDTVRRLRHTGADFALVDDLSPEVVPELLTLAETGCLIVAVMHVRGAAAAIDRLCNAPHGLSERAARALVAGQLICVASLELCAGLAGRPVLAREFLVVTPALAGLIAGGEFDRIDDAITTGRKYEMELLDEHLLRLVRTGAIDRKEALDHSRNPAAMQERFGRGGADDNTGDDDDGAGVPARPRPSPDGAAAEQKPPEA